MLLQSIELQNFRQFINEKIDFSTDPDRISGASMVKPILPIRLCSIGFLQSR